MSEEHPVGSAEAVIATLGLVPHPTCGYAAVTHQLFQRDIRGLDGAAVTDRAMASVLYFLVTPEAPLRLHRIPTPQMYHHYFGSSLEVLLLYPDGTGEVAALGPDIAGGARPQLLIPAATWHVSHVLDEHGFALLGTTEWGSFDAGELELGDLLTLEGEYPAFQRHLRSLAGGG
jgi:predicted cupin superfamily sugar epimerase